MDGKFGGGRSARYEKLAHPREKVINTDKTDPYKVKRGALSYRITDSLDKLATPKKIHDPNEPSHFPSSQHSQLAKIRSDSDRVTRASKPLLRSQRNQLKLDTYAAMVVKNDNQCPKRIRKLARPKGGCSSTVDYNP